jgi:16S rRNA (uracil1498-N3)-methyltransferase
MKIIPIFEKSIEMQIFYAPGIYGDTWTLDEKESKHCIRVLRMRRDTPVRLIDGKGNMFEGVIAVADPKRCTISINRVTDNFEKRNYNLHIAISPLKNPERLEWFIEKSVEIGIDEITPLICKNTEKQTIKAERINNIIISAMKQSLKAKLTVLNEPVAFKEFISRADQSQKMIAHCVPGTEKNSIADVYRKGKDALILIGPEGDFSEEEIRSALSSGFMPVHLGSSRLRTETAGVAACHSVYFLNQ